MEVLVRIRHSNRECMRSKYARDSMNRCQKIVLYACLNVSKTVSTDAMQVLMGVLPWDLECVRTGLIRMIVNGWSICENELVNVDELNGRSVEKCVKLVKERMPGGRQDGTRV